MVVYSWLLMDTVRYPNFLSLRLRTSLGAQKAGALVGHLEEQQIRQLLDVVAEMHTVCEQDVAVVLEFLVIP